MIYRKLGLLTLAIMGTLAVNASAFSLWGGGDSTCQILVKNSDANVKPEYRGGTNNAAWAGLIAKGYSPVENDDGKSPFMVYLSWDFVIYYGLGAIDSNSNGSATLFTNSGVQIGSAKSHNGESNYSGGLANVAEAVKQLPNCVEAKVKVQEYLVNFGPGSPNAIAKENLKKVTQALADLGYSVQCGFDLNGDCTAFLSDTLLPLLRDNSNDLRFWDRAQNVIEVGNKFATRGNKAIVLDINASKVDLLAYLKLKQ